MGNGQDKQQLREEVRHHSPAFESQMNGTQKFNNYYLENGRAVRLKWSTDERMFYTYILLISWCILKLLGLEKQARTKEILKSYAEKKWATRIPLLCRRLLCSTNCFKMLKKDVFRGICRLKMSASLCSKNLRAVYSISRS